MSWKDENLAWHFVEKWAAEKPDAECLIFEDERLTWKAFRDNVDLAAKAFLETGVEKGGRVAMLSMARTEFPITYMAASKVGASWLGLTPKFTLDELRYQVGDSKPSVLVTLREYQGADLSKNVMKLMEEFPFIKKVLVIGEPFDGAESYGDFVGRPRAEMDSELEKRAAGVKPADDLLILYTSGSTGKPKGVVHTHQSVIENVKVEVEKFYFNEKTRGLLHFPINHVAADVEIGFACIYGGGCIVCMDKFDPAASLRTIQEEKITVMGQVPVMFLLQMKQPEFFETDFSNIGQFIWAGAAAPKVMLDALGNISSQTGAKMLTGYGSTEVGGFVTYTDKDDGPETLAKSAGKIAEAFELKIVDGNRRELPDGEVGEIAVRGPFLMKGYLNKPDETEKVIDGEGWYYTSDLAYRDEKGYIFIAGRSSEMYKSGGENVYPREVEDAIESHPMVLFAAVVAVPDEIFQEVGWAFVMPPPGMEVTEDELKKHCKGRLANFKVPKKFIIRPMLPILSNGKVNKLALKEEVKGMMEKS